MSAQSRTTPAPNIPNKAAPEVTESLPQTASRIQPFNEKDSYASVNHDYELVQWRHLPNDIKHRFYEETVFFHQPGAHYNSVTRTRKYGVDETNLVSRYSSNQLSGIFAIHNLERLKGKQ
tara:strand:+ start:253 stop:612 length:360 start_codon:yes stop_codon:yes gene_type:complete